MKITKNNVDKYMNKKDLKRFNAEDEEVKEMIIHALNRKSIKKDFKNGVIIEVSYKYIDGEMALDMKLIKNGKTLWSNIVSSDIYDGEETKTFIINECVKTFLNYISDHMDDEGLRLLKKILFV